MCSTPFGINERTTIGDAVIQARSPTCSTPFGINERTTRIVPSPIMSCLVCSTPFGINERFTSAGLRRSVERSSRAALCSTPSASTNGSRYESGGVRCRCGRGCSTPFGINERFTRPCCRVRPSHTPPLVLNAFRHQRTVHLPLPPPPPDPDFNAFFFFFFFFFFF